MPDSEIKNMDVFKTLTAGFAIWLGFESYFAMGQQNITADRCIEENDGFIISKFTDPNTNTFTIDYCRNQTTNKAVIGNFTTGCLFVPYPNKASDVISERKRCLTENYRMQSEQHGVSIGWDKEKINNVFFELCGGDQTTGSCCNPDNKRCGRGAGYCMMYILDRQYFSMEFSGNLVEISEKDSRNCFLNETLSPVELLNEFLNILKNEAEEVERFRANRTETENGSGYGSGSGSEYGAGSGSGYGTGNGNGRGSGYGSGSGSEYGAGSGSGYGTGNGNGRGSGYGTRDGNSGNKIIETEENGTEIYNRTVETELGSGSGAGSGNSEYENAEIEQASSSGNANAISGENELGNSICDHKVEEFLDVEGGVGHSYKRTSLCAFLGETCSILDWFV
eukprot:TCONS_00025158-protein